MHNQKSTPPRPPRREVTIRPSAIADAQVLADLDALAHLKRTTRQDIVADLIKKTLGHTFADQIKAA